MTGLAGGRTADPLLLPFLREAEGKPQHPVCPPHQSMGCITLDGGEDAQGQSRWAGVSGRLAGEVPMRGKNLLSAWSPRLSATLGLQGCGSL